MHANARAREPDSTPVGRLTASFSGGLSSNAMQPESNDGAATKYDVAAVEQRLDLLSSEVRAHVTTVGAELRTEVSRAVHRSTREMYLALLMLATVMFAFVCFLAAVLA
jgi:hypothetical protein